MPHATPQATPGPSTHVNMGPFATSNDATATVLQSQTNAPEKKDKKKKGTKRAHTDAPEDVEMRDAKKVKVDRAVTSDGQETDTGKAKDKDNKKRRRRRKKKPVSAIVLDSSLTRRRGRSESQSRSTTLSISRVDSMSAILANATSSTVAATTEGTNQGRDSEEVPTYSSSDKGKGKAKSSSPLPREPEMGLSVQPVTSASGEGNSNTTAATSSASTSAGVDDPEVSDLARLREKFAEQTKLLERHQAYLNNHHQALTCQICLDVMHRPYALTPCGHITCYGCLVRWFTAPQNPNEAPAPNANEAGQQPHPEDVDHILNSAPAKRGNFIRRRKTCPICRGAVTERPVEMWGIKDMVSALVRSHLVDMPAPPQRPTTGNNNNAANNNNKDPWRNVFRTAHRARQWDNLHTNVPPPLAAAGEADREDLGWYDAEDGGIYRCIDCFHEIWDGVCSGCGRQYDGHDHDMDDEEDDDAYELGFMGGPLDFADEEDDEAYIPRFDPLPPVRWWDLADVDGIDLDEDEEDEEGLDWGIGVAGEDGDEEDVHWDESEGADDNEDDDDDDEGGGAGGRFGGVLDRLGLRRRLDQPEDEDHLAMMEARARNRDVGAGVLDLTGDEEFNDSDSDAVEIMDEDDAAPIPRRAAAFGRRRILSDDEEDVEDDGEDGDSDVVRSIRMHFGNAGGRRRVVLDDDDEDEDEESDEAENSDDARAIRLSARLGGGIRLGGHGGGGRYGVHEDSDNESEPRMDEEQDDFGGADFDEQDDEGDGDIYHGFDSDSEY